MSIVGGDRYFSNELFEFLRELAENNNRPWFQKNKERYERHIKEPALRFIEEFAPHLHKVSPHFVADPRPVGGSLFRIYRDARFSRDKSPYKTNVGIRFTHEAGRDAHAPGYYLGIANDGIFAACGAWHPDSRSLRRIRQAIVENPAAWKRASKARRFADAFKLEGDTLKTAPRGFDPEHPLIEDLRRKDFVGVSRLTKKTVTGPDLLPRFTELCRSAAPFQKFLCAALEVEY